MKRRSVAVVGAAAICVAAAIVVALLVGTSGGRGARGTEMTTPGAVTAAVFTAAEHNDTTTVREHLCAADRRIGMTDLFADPDFRSFSVGRVTPAAGEAVRVQVVLDKPDGTTLRIRVPVVRRSGTWTVCLTQSNPAGVSLPPVSPPTSLPPPTRYRCASKTTGFETAQNYISAENSNRALVAQACVWKQNVPLLTTIKLSRGHPSFRTDDTSASGPVVHYRSVRERVVVTTKREPDGYFYVTHVQILPRLPTRDGR